MTAAVDRHIRIVLTVLLTAAAALYLLNLPARSPMVANHYLGTVIGESTVYRLT